MSDGSAEVRHLIRSRDPWPVVLAAVSATVYAAHGFHGYLSRDLGLYAYAGQMVADGHPPYVELLNRSGPLSHWLPGVGALGARLVGVDDLIGMRVFFLVLTVACVVVTYLATRDLLDSRLAGVVAAAALLAVHGFSNYASNGPREKTAMYLFLIAMFLALIHRRFGWAGFFVALSTLTWQPVFAVAMVACLAGAALAGPGQRLRAVGRVIIGGLIPSVATVAYFVLAGAWRDFYQSFVWIHLNYTRQPGLSGSEGPVLWRDTVAALGPVLWVLVAGLVAVLGCAGWWVLCRRDDHPDLLGAVSLAAGTVAALAWSLRIYNGWGDALVLVPMACMGVGVIAWWLARTLPGRSGRMVAIAAVMVALVDASVFSLTTRNHEYDDLRNQTRVLLAVLGEGATIQSIEAPQPLVVTGELNPTRHQMFLAGLQDFVDDRWPGGLSGFAERIEQDRPTLLSVSRVPPPYWLQPMLDRSYRKLGEGTGFAWYVSDEVDPATVARLQSALHG